jgi:hypothetical protein
MTPLAIQSLNQALETNADSASLRRHRSALRSGLMSGAACIQDDAAIDSRPINHRAHGAPEDSGTIVGTRLKGRRCSRFDLADVLFPEPGSSSERAGYLPVSFHVPGRRVPELRRSA